LTGNFRVIKYRWFSCHFRYNKIMDLERSDSEDPFPENNLKKIINPKRQGSAFWVILFE